MTGYISFIIGWSERDGERLLPEGAGPAEVEGLVWV